MHKAIVLLSILMMAMPSFAGSGGSTVGDGGHTVSCKSPKYYGLLDLFENGFSPDDITLDRRFSLKQMIEILVQRVERHPRFVSVNLTGFHKALTDFVASMPDNWGYKNGSAKHVIRARRPALSQKTMHELERRDCRLIPLAIRRSEVPFDSLFHRLCEPEASFCFYFDSFRFRNLGHTQQACLAIHEALRFLPNEVALSERNLRKLTAEICTMK